MHVHIYAGRISSCSLLCEQVACFACAYLDVPHIKFFAAATRLDQDMLLLVLRANEKGLCLAAQDCSSSLALDDMERHPGPTIAALMKLSFDEEHRHAMCQLGGLHAVAELIQVRESTVI